MATKLEKPLKREVQIGEQPYMLTISPEGLKLVPKGKRNGLELAWKALISGEAALASALNASVQENAKNGPDVVATQGKPEALDPGGQAGGGSSATCIGC